MTRDAALKRGGVYPVNLGPEGEGVRETCPCLVVSNNVSNEYSPVVTVLPLSFSRLEKIYEFETLLPSAKTGLDRDAKVSSHILFTIDKSRVTGERVGFLNKALMERVGGALRVQLAL
jgi:mRNA interferase MazF